MDRYFEPSSEVVAGSDEHAQQQQELVGVARGVAVDGNQQRQLNSPLMLIEGFLQALTNTDSDSRIVISRKGVVRLTL